MSVTNVGDKAAIKTLQAVSGGLWNLKANLMVDIVDQHGPARSLGWFATNMPKYERILKRWGPLRTHYLASVISALNGCGYCTYGHAYAFNLHFFDRQGRVFPLDEDQMMNAGSLDRHSIVSLFQSALNAGGMSEEIPWVERTIELYDSRVANTAHAEADDAGEADDKAIFHLVDMFAWLNACGIQGGTEPDEAHDPINKNTELRTRYETARQNN